MFGQSRYEKMTVSEKEAYEYGYSEGLIRGFQESRSTITVMTNLMVELLKTSKNEEKK